MIHKLNLATEPFNAIKSGNKTIESRLYDEKRQQIELGDKLIFINREDPGQKLSATVTGLLKYPSFAEMFTSNDPTKFGGSSARWLLKQIRQFYTNDLEQKYGVLGIEFTLN